MAVGRALIDRRSRAVWRAHPATDRDWADAHLINAAIDIHHDDLEFGYRIITDELPDRGITASPNRVSRLCTQQR